MFPILASAALAATIEAVKVASVPVKDPNAAEWQKAKSVDVPLMAQQVAYPTNPKPTVASVRVRALADDDWVAVRIEWSDPSKDDRVEVSDFTDGVALEIPLGDAATANPMMGMKGQPMYIVNWKAVWQNDAEHGHADVQDYHPGFYTDAYPFATGEYPYPVEESFETSDARRYLVATSAGNPMAKLHRRWPVEELLAEGFGTLASHRLQDASGWGVHTNGTWVVVLAAPRMHDDPSNPALVPGSNTAVGFAVWDGGAGNVGGRKHWSALNELVLP
ncbi:MAG: ethylbenzene dehydrogenase-related protein [Myxococcota bacterium]